MKYNNITDWFSESDNWWHIIIGMIFGILCIDWYMSTVVGLSIGMGMEYKDWKYTKNADPIDPVITTIGTLLGYMLRMMIGGN